MKNVKNELCRLLLDILTCIIVIIFSVLVKSNMTSVSDSYAVLKKQVDNNIAIIKSKDNDYFVKNYSDKKVRYKLALVLNAKDNIDGVNIALNAHDILIDENNSFIENDHYYVIIDEKIIDGYLAKKYNIKVISEDVSNYQLTIIM